MTYPRTPAKPRHAPEEHVQFAIAQVLDELGVLWCHVANEALQRGGLVYGAQLVALGVKTGVPDCLIFTPPPAYPRARGVALEIKTLVGAASPDQKRWLTDLQTLGWASYTERGTYACLDRLRALGWDVDAALSRLAARGYVLDGERLLPPNRARARKTTGSRA